MTDRRPLVLGDDGLPQRLQPGDTLLGVDREVYAQADDPAVTQPSINFKPDPAFNVSFMRVFIP